MTALEADASPRSSEASRANNPSPTAGNSQAKPVRVKHHVDVRNVPRPSHDGGKLAKPFLPAPRTAAGPRLAQPAPSQPVVTAGLAMKSPRRTSSAPTGTATPLAAASSAVVEQLTTFPTLGNVNGKAPSDTQLAVGPTYIVQLVNVTGQIYDKAGNTVGAAFDLGTFFGFAAGSGTDPRVHYDAAAGRFFAAYEGLPAGGDETDVAVSDTSDPRGGWTVYDVADNTSNVLQDQEKLGYSNDKVTLSWNNYDNTKNPQPFLGVVTAVISKADLLAGGTINIVTFAQDSGKFQVVPATSLSSINDQLAMWHAEGSTDVHVVTITGVPGVNAVNQSDNTIAIGTADSPPAAAQPSGGDPNITTNDARMLSVAWQNNHLWGVFNVQCTPDTDTTTRACQRYVQVSTNGGQSLATNVNLGLVGGDIYFGSVALDSEDDLFSGFTASSSSMFATAVMIGLPGGNFPGTTFGDFYSAGSKAYICGCGNNPDGSLNSRWGDYSGTARDPSNPKDMWTVQQIGGLANNDWGTAMDRVTLFPPTVTSVSPTHGPELASCVTTVTVRGTEFANSGTSVKFGSTFASNVHVIAPDQLTADAPSLPRGTVDVTVTTPDGTSATSAADLFTYDADTAAPTTGASISPSPNSAGWNTTSPATVNISAADGSCGSGVQKITYSATGAQTIGSTDVFSSNAAVPITAQGVTTVTFTATDNAGNTSAPQTITVRLDTVAPSITITSPAATTYLVNQVVKSAYSCTDATSGVASCIGTVPNGSPIDTSTFGSHTFTVNAADIATNPASSSISYKVAYKICLLYDPTQPPRGGSSTMPIKLQLCNANNVNLSSPSITLTPSQIVGPVTRSFTTPFRYDATLAGYIVNVGTKGLPAGTYNLQFTISGADTTIHTATFTIR
jgi:hypothetical protein